MFVVIEERFTYFYTLTKISNEPIGFKVSYAKNRIWFEVRTTNLLERLHGSLIQIDANMQNAFDLHIIVRYLLLIQIVPTIAS